VTLHFFANDIIMCFHFALAMKEITEALLPGGSLNPPSKATNPLITTLGGLVGPIVCYFLFLEAFVLLGLFDAELARGVTFSDLARGWGVVTATDVALAWCGGRFVFGDGHPAIDFLLLLAVVADAVGLAIIAVFYSDPDHPVRPVYLLVVGAGMGSAYALRRWHFRKERATHQAWQPYLVFSGAVTWVGLINARLHPAIALAFVVPFMPGPDREKLQQLDDEVGRKKKHATLCACKPAWPRPGSSSSTTR
jgi:NhaA family Na+:H+ antiporter